MTFWQYKSNPPKIIKNISFLEFMIFDDYQVHSVVGLQGQKVRKKSEPELLGHPVKCNTETSSWHHFSWSAPPLLYTLMQNLNFGSKIPFYLIFQKFWLWIVGAKHEIFEKLNFEFLNQNCVFAAVCKAYHVFSTPLAVPLVWLEQQSRHQTTKTKTCLFVLLF